MIQSDGGIPQGAVCLRRPVRPFRLAGGPVGKEEGRTGRERFPENGEREGLKS